MTKLESRFCLNYLLFMLVFFLLFKIIRSIILFNLINFNNNTFPIVFMILNCIFIILNVFLSTVIASKQLVKTITPGEFLHTHKFIHMFYLIIILMNILLSFAFYKYNLNIVFKNINLVEVIKESDVNIKKNDTKIYNILFVINIIITSIFIFFTMKRVNQKLVHAENN